MGTEKRTGTKIYDFSQDSPSVTFCSLPPLFHGQIHKQHHIHWHLLLLAMHSVIYTHNLSPLYPVLIQTPQTGTESITQPRDREALSSFYVTKLSIVLELCSYGKPESKNMRCPFLNLWHRQRPGAKQNY